MQLKVYRFSFIAIAVSTAFSVQTAEATGIPVYCYNCQEATNNAAHSILDGMRSQTEAIVNALDYVARLEGRIDQQKAVADSKIKNSYAMEPSLGAKPRAACGQYAAAGLRSSGASGGKKVSKAFRNWTKRSNAKASQLAPGEPKMDYFVKDILTKMDEDDYDSFELAMQDDPIPVTNTADVTKKRDELQLLLNPFPVSLPTQQEIDRIKKNGTPNEKQQLAQSIVLNRRMEVAHGVLNEKFQSNLQSIDSKDVKYMLDDVKDFLSDEDKKLLSGDKISPAQLDELLATYRVKSPKWFTSIATNASPEGLQREQVFLQAEILNQLYSLKVEMKANNRLSAVDIGRKISQDGMQAK